LWPEAAPGVPNPVIRSALFPAIKSKDRRLMRRIGFDCRAETHRLNPGR
jgi:hypothetical protein